MIEIGDHEEYVDALRQSVAENSSYKQRRAAMGRVQSALREQDHKDYMERYVEALLPVTSNVDHCAFLPALQRFCSRRICVLICSRSGTASILLATAFQRFPNLREITLNCTETRDNRLSIRRHLSGGGGSTTYMISLLCACLPYMEGKLRKLRMGMFLEVSNDEEGVSVQSLFMPQEVRECFGRLETLQLHLQTRNGDIEVRQIPQLDMLPQ